MKAPCLAVLLSLTSPAIAQTAQPCDWIARADAIIEPWEDYTRTYSNGNVRLALLDVVEPAGGAMHILILSPPFQETGERQCMTLGLTESIGFGNVDFENLTAEYNAANGLIFKVLVEVFDGTKFVIGQLRFTLNQQTGQIEAAIK